MNNLLKASEQFLVATTSSLYATLCTATCCALLLASCNASDATVMQDTPLASGEDSLSTSDSETDSGGYQRTEIVTGPTENAEMGLTVGEQLKRLDSLMRIVPPDSLEVLMAEYDRLLDSVMLAQRISQEENNPNQERSSTPETPAIADVSTQSAEQSYVRSTPRSQVTNADPTTLVQSRTNTNQSFEPSEYNGIRESEINYYQQEKETTPAPLNTTQTPKQTALQNQAANQTPVPTPAATPRANATANTTADNKSNTAATPVVTNLRSTEGATATPRTTSTTRKRYPTSGRRTTTAPSTSNSQSRTRSRRSSGSSSSSLDENYTEGLASFRAGNYSDAITNLKPVANSSSSSYRAIARYYYALSLERTGSLSQAASSFRSAMKGSGDIADKSWVSYARVLAKQGKKNQAKKEILRLIEQRPASSQIANARKLLQEL